MVVEVGSRAKGESEGDRLVMQVGCPGRETDEGRVPFPVGTFPGGIYHQSHAHECWAFSALRPSLCVCTLLFPVQLSHAPPSPPPTHTSCMCA